MCNPKTITCILITGMVLSLTVLAGCGKSKANEELERRKFSDAIASADSQLTETKRNFISVLKPFRDDQPGNKAELRKAYEQFQKVLNEATSGMASLTIPPSADCQELAKAFQRFLATEEKVVVKEFGEIVRLVETAQDKLDIVAKLEIVGALKRSTEAEAPDRQAMRKAAQEFDKEQKRRESN